MLLDQPKLHLDSKLVAPSVVWLVYVRPPYSLIQHVARLGYWYGYKPIAINLSSTNQLIRIAGVPAYPRLDEKTDNGVDQPGSLVFSVLTFRLWRSQGGLEGLGSNHSRTSICNFCWLQFRCT